MTLRCRIDLLDLKLGLGIALAATAAGCGAQEAKRVVDARQVLEPATVSQTVTAPHAEGNMLGEYDYPYPKRDNPFQLLERSSAPATVEQMAMRGVVVRGFVNVSKLQAVLAVDGKVAVLGKGDREYGVEVREITPPHVDYVRDAVRRTATLRQ